MAQEIKLDEQIYQAIKNGKCIVLCHESVLHVFQNALKDVEGIEIHTHRCGEQEWEVITKEQYEERI